MTINLSVYTKDHHRDIVENSPFSISRFPHVRNGVTNLDIGATELWLDDLALYMLYDLITQYIKDHGITRP